MRTSAYMIFSTKDLTTACMWTVLFFAQKPGEEQGNAFCLM